jgi:hypothetical protein
MMKGGFALLNLFKIDRSTLSLDPEALDGQNTFLRHAVRLRKIRYSLSVSFVRPNPKFGAKLAIIWQNEHFLRGLQGLNFFFVLNPER